MTDYFWDIIKEISDKKFSSEYFDEFYRWILQLHSLKVEEIPGKKSKLVTIDGIGGSGKDSCIEALCSLNKNFEAFREDDVDPFHHYLRRFWDMPNYEDYNPSISAYLITAGKKYVNEAILGKGLQDSSKIVVTNRSFLSSIAYSFRTPWDELLRVYATFPCIPDVRVVLICNPNIARERVLKRGVIGMSDSEEFLRKSYDSFLKIREHFPEVKVIDTSHLSIEETAKEVMSLIGK